MIDKIFQSSVSDDMSKSSGRSEVTKTGQCNKVLSTVDLTKSFHSLPANVGISLDLFAGEIHALIGPNGAGKSTFIKQIAGSLKPDAGRVELNGTNVTELDTAARAKLGLARTFQVSALAMENTVLENVMLGTVGSQKLSFSMFKPVLQMSAVREKALSALQRVGLEERATTPAAELSHGERRQLEIAVALSLHPKAFVMDEPMAGLGAQGSGKLTRLLGKLKAEAPILLVEHDMDAVFALADRISVLVNGELIFTGTTDDVRNNSDVRRAYLGDKQ